MADLILISESAPPAKIPYATIATWHYAASAERLSILAICVKTGDARADLALHIHNLVEGYLCHKSGVTAADRERFTQGLGGAPYPGTHPDAPHYTAHMLATAVENSILAAVGMSRETYDTLLLAAFAKVKTALGV